MKLESVKEKIKNVNGWLSDPEVEFLYRTARECTGKGEIVEIGSWQGRSTICLAGASQEGINKTIHAIDPHQDSYVHQDFLGGKGISTFEAFKENIKGAGVEGLVSPIVKKSEDAVAGWNKKIEFLWIDGDHRYSEVKKDFDLWSPFVLEGGVVAFHDSTYDDVKAFLIKEVLPSKSYRHAQLRDSVLSVVRSDVHVWSDSLRAKYVAAVMRAESFLRKIPVPSGMRAGVKKFGKRMLNLASS